MSLPPSTDERTATKDKKSFWGEPQAVAAVIAAVIGAMGAIVVALIGSGVISVSAGPAVQPPSTPTAPPPSSTGPAPTPTTATPEPEPTSTVAVRRSTGKNPITLTDQYAADLDSKDGGWAVANAAANSDWDIEFEWGGLGAAEDLAMVKGPVKYETCQNATGYRVTLDEKYVESGTRLCVRTSEDRFAFVTIKDVDSDPAQIALDVTVWEE
jgi:hypothetical protein